MVEHIMCIMVAVGQQSFHYMKQAHLEWADVKFISSEKVLNFLVIAIMCTSSPKDKF